MNDVDSQYRSVDDTETPLVDDIMNLLRKQYGAQFTRKCSHERLGFICPVSITV
jgi:hypothetical protein